MNKQISLLAPQHSTDLPAADPTALARPDSQPPPVAIPVDQLPQITGLTAEQRTALTCIVGGETHARAAQAARVSRSTLYNWEKNDPDYIAALNALRDHLIAGARDRLIAALGHAATTVIDQAARGNLRAALALLKHLGALTPPAPGPITPDYARRALAERSMREGYESIRLRVESGTALGTISRTPAGRIVDAMDRIAPTYQRPDYDEAKKYCDALQKMAWENEVEERQKWNAEVNWKPAPDYEGGEGI